MTISSSNSKHWGALIVLCAAQFMVILDAAIIDVSAQDSGLASGLINTSQQIGSAIVLALLVTIFSAHTKAASLSSGNSLEMQMNALTEGFRFAFLIGAALPIVGVFVAMLLIHGGGSRRSSKGHKAPFE